MAAQSEGMARQNDGTHGYWRMSVSDASKQRWVRKVGVVEGVKRLVPGDHGRGCKQAKLGIAEACQVYLATKTEVAVPSSIE